MLLTQDEWSFRLPKHKLGCLEEMCYLHYRQNNPIHKDIRALLCVYTTVKHGTLCMCLSK